MKSAPEMKQESKSDPNCIFCKIVEQKLPSKKLAEDDHLIVLKDIMPQAPTHILVIPKIHVPNLAQLEDADLVARLFMKATAIANELNLTNGYRLVVNTGADGGQTVHHLHIHLLAGRSLGWPPG